MQPPEKPWFCRIGKAFASQFAEAMEERMNNDDIGIQTVNSWREDEVEPKSMDPAIPRAENPIHQEPGEKLQKMGTRDGRNFTPEGGPGIFWAWPGWFGQREIFNALSIKMNLTMLAPREALEQFGKRALSAMPAINER
jgi:hypothetical protein